MKWKRALSTLLAVLLLVSLLPTAVFAESSTAEVSVPSVGYLQSKIPSPDGKAVYMARNGSPFFTWTGMNTHAEDNQYFAFELVSNGLYSMVNLSANQAVTATDSGNLNLAAIDHGDGKQLWSFEAGADGYVYIRNSFTQTYITTPRTKNTDAMDQYLQLSEKAEGAADRQLWYLGDGLTASLQNGISSESGSATYLALDGDGVYLTWTGNGSHAESNQFYAFNYLSNGAYQLLRIKDDKAVSVTDDETKPVQSEPADAANAAQQWYFENAESGFYRIRSAANGLYLTSPRSEASTAMDFKYLTLSEKSDAQGQLWKTDLALQTVSAPDTPDVPGEPSTLPDASTGVVYTIYSAYDDPDIQGSETVDPEFGTVAGTLNSSLSPRILELKHQSTPANNGRLLATFECNRLPKSDAALVAEKWKNGENFNANLSSFPIYESIDGGATWGAGDTGKPARGGNYLPVGYVQNQNSTNGVTGMRNCPELFEMPETIGDLVKGTILCAGNSIEAGTSKCAADVSQSNTTYLDLCVSTDVGRTWTHHSSIAGPFTGACKLNSNTAWEPFFFVWDHQLYCFYSDEGFDNTNDQNLSYAVYDGSKWEGPFVVVQSNSRRPGMPILAQLENGQFMMVYERDGGSSSGYVLSAVNDPTVWYAKDGAEKNTKDHQHLNWDDAVRINGNGAPYVITTKSGTILYNNTALSSLYVNSAKDPSDPGAFWIEYATGLSSAYNRQIVELSNGNIMIPRGVNDSGITCTILDFPENFAETVGSVQSKIDFQDHATYMAFDGTAIMTWTGLGDHAEPNQYYEFREVETGTYLLINTAQGKAVSSGTSRVELRTVNPDDSKQLWSFEAGGGGWYYIWNHASGLYLTTPRASASTAMDYSYLGVSAKADVDTQLWKPEVSVAEKAAPDTSDYYSLTLVPADGVEIELSSTRAAAGHSVTITVTKKEHCESINEIVVYPENDQHTLVNGKSISFTETSSGATATVAVDKDLVITAKTTLEDYYVSVPTNNHTGRNQCLSPRIVESLDGTTLWCTFESALTSYTADGEFTFPIYRSMDKGKTWEKISEIVNDDTVHPDEYYIVTYNNGIPASATQVSADTEGAICHPWSMHNCPQLFVLPEAWGGLEAGTLLCAGDAVTIEKNAKKVSDAGDGGLWKTSLDLYYSVDGGVTWRFHSTIAAGGRNIMGYDPVWEPFFVFNEGRLICYYSDERIPNGKQKLVYSLNMGTGGGWTDPVDILDYNGNGRPGMPILAQLTNGKWILVSEIPTRYKISDDLLNWEPVNTYGLEWGAGGGSPYVLALQDGRIVVGDGTLSEVFINTKRDCTGAWIKYETGAIGGYNRCFLQLRTGEFLICGSKGFDKQDNYIYVKSLNVEDAFKEDEVLLRSYNLVNSAKDEVIGIEADSMSVGANAITWTFKGNSMNQIWTPVRCSNGSYYLKNYQTGLVLSVKNGALVQTTLNESEAAQNWTATLKEDGTVILCNCETGMYLTAADGSHSLILSETNDALAQRWQFRTVADDGKAFSPDCPHANKTHVEAKDATCTQLGNKDYWHCEDCGQNFSDENCQNVLDSVTIPAEGHSPVHIDRVEPTTESNGNIEYWVCSKCGSKFKDADGTETITDVTIPKLDKPSKPSGGTVKPVSPNAGVNKKPEAEKKELPFTDVPQTAWYRESVQKAWEIGLIDGVTKTQFQPDGTLTVAQAIKLAAALYQMEHEGEVNLKNGRVNWYDSYVSYAVANGIIEKDYASYTAAQMNAAITRAEFVHIFHGAENTYKAINQVADDAIPDVKTSDAFASDIYEFYRAGILTGSDAKGTFHPVSSIKRSEVSAILVRMFDTASRQSITLK